MGRRIPRRCLGYLEHGLLRPREYRQLLAKGLKYVLPPPLWSISLDCGDDDELVHQMRRVFHAFGPDQMHAVGEETKCLRQYVGLHHGLRPSASTRVRRKRIRLYTNWIRRKMKKAGYGRREDLAGLIPFAQCVDIHLRIYLGDGA